MAKTRRRRSRRSYRRRRRSNPLFSHGRVRHYRRRRRNPGFGGASVRDLGGLILWGTAGAVAARSLPQMVLGGNNSGFMGYGANALVAIVGGGLVGRFAGGQAGKNFTAGGIIALGLRIFADTVGSKFSGLSGDLDFDLGYYIGNSFPLPTTGAGPYLLQPGSSGLPMMAGGIPGSPIAQISPAPGGTVQAGAPGAPAVVPDEPGRWATRWS